MSQCCDQSQPDKVVRFGYDCRAFFVTVIDSDNMLSIV
jgi:hypothetical protein